jgi:hypothetical protein
LLTQPFPMIAYALFSTHILTLHVTSSAGQHRRRYLTIVGGGSIWPRMPGWVMVCSGEWVLARWATGYRLEHDCDG